MPTDNEILAAEDARLQEELRAYHVQEQGARWAVERLTRLVERAHFLGRPKREARLREEAARQLALAAKADEGWRATWACISEKRRDKLIFEAATSGGVASNACPEPNERISLETVLRAWDHIPPDPPPMRARMSQATLDTFPFQRVELGRSFVPPGIPVRVDDSLPLGKILVEPDIDEPKKE